MKFGADALERDGMVVVERAASGEEVARILASLDELDFDARAGARQVHLNNGTVREWVGSASTRRFIERFLPGAFPVRSILFDKSPETNWGVPWHQDLTICVRQRAEVDGFTGWSVKDGVVHVQPPVAVLERMVTLRLSLDRCGAENGALEVIVGSHRSGRLSQVAIEGWKETGEVRVCETHVGGAVVMKPLVLHASRRATGRGRRRVLHVEFAAEKLPEPLRWM